jgi:hypothetical protein
MNEEILQDDEGFVIENNPNQQEAQAQNAQDDAQNLRDGDEYAYHRMIMGQEENQRENQRTKRRFYVERRIGVE